jgi:hypothetical protein
VVDPLPAHESAWARWIPLTVRVPAMVEAQACARSDRSSTLSAAAMRQE